MSKALHLVQFNEQTQIRIKTEFGLTYNEPTEESLEIYFVSKNKLLSGFFNQSEVTFVPFKETLKLKNKVDFTKIKINQLYVDFETQMTSNVTEGFVEQLEEYVKFVENIEWDQIPGSFMEEFNQFFDAYEQYTTQTLNLYMKIKTFLRENEEDKHKENNFYIYEQLEKMYKENLQILNQAAKQYNQLYEDEGQETTLFDENLLN